MAEQKKVSIYTTPTCPYCKQTKEYLKEKGIKYSEIDVAADSAKAQEMIDKSGQMGCQWLILKVKLLLVLIKKRLIKP